jgi:O-6-methylguanine DNA methyltransferase
MAQYYVVFATKLGWMGIIGSEAGLSRVILPKSSVEGVSDLIWEKSASLNPSFFGDLPSRLKRYFDGEPVTFADKLDLSQSSSFQKVVGEKVKAIPYGETRSYKWIAQEIGKPKANRAIGQALARNPLPIIIPCHRVIGAQGDLVGFKEGLKIKQYLLQMEKGG